jgi:hypothetical protein
MTFCQGNSTDSIPREPYNKTLRIWFILLVLFTVNSVAAQEISNKETIQGSIDSLRQVKAQIDSQIKLLVKNLSRIEAAEIEESYANSPNMTYPATMKMKTNLKEAANPFASTIMVLQPGMKVNVKYHENGTYLLAEYQGKHGYIVPSTLKDVPIEIQRIKRGRESAKKAKLSGEKKTKLVKKWGEDIGRKISRGQIWIGMTSEMARSSRGRPKDINRTVYSFGTREQWVYPNSVYLYFDNGILTSWQD